MVRRTRFPCRHHVAAVEFRRAQSGGNRRPALVRRSAHLRIGARHLQMLCLYGDRRKVSLALYGFLLRGGTHLDATLAAIEADTVHDGHVVDDGGVINIVDVHDIDVGHGTVIAEVPAIPPAAFETVAEIPEAIVDPTVKADR